MCSSLRAWFGHDSLFWHLIVGQVVDSELTKIPEVVLVELCSTKFVVDDAVVQGQLQTLGSRP